MFNDAPPSASRRARRRIDADVSRFSGCPLWRAPCARGGRASLLTPTKFCARVIFKQTYDMAHCLSGVHGLRAQALLWPTAASWVRFAPAALFRGQTLVGWILLDVR